MNKYVPFGQFVLLFFIKVKIVWIFHIFVELFILQNCESSAEILVVKLQHCQDVIWRKCYLIKMVYDVPKCNVIFFRKYDIVFAFPQDRWSNFWVRKYGCTVATLQP